MCSVKSAVRMAAICSDVALLSVAEIDVSGSLSKKEQRLKWPRSWFGSVLIHVWSSLVSVQHFYNYEA